MTERFEFQDGDEEFEVSGTYGRGPNQVFTVTKRLSGASQDEGQNWRRIELAASVDSEYELLTRLRQSYPHLARFRPF